MGIACGIDMEQQSFHFEALPPEAKRAIESFSQMPMFRTDRWYLAGGTALAFQVGHRRSVDLDFFTREKNFDEVKLERTLINTGSWDTSSSDSGTLYGEYMGAKVSFIAYPFFVPSGVYAEFGMIKILVPEDIAVMKIIAISQRCKKRDFVDLYWYAKHREPLEAVLQRVQHQYPGKHLNFPHFIKSLLYFADAEADPMPTLLFKASWEDIKAYFRHEVPRIGKELMGLK